MEKIRFDGRRKEERAGRVIFGIGDAGGEWGVTGAGTRFLSGYRDTQMQQRRYLVGGLSGKQIKNG